MSRSTQAEQKMLNALNALKQTYSTTAFREWNARKFVTEMKIGGQLPTVLKSMKLIDTMYGRVKLNESIMTVRPRTVINAMNKYSTAIRKSKTKVQTPNLFSNLEPKQENLDEIVIMLEKKIKEKILKDLLAKLS